MMKQSKFYMMKKEIDQIVNIIKEINQMENIKN